jgi:GNAT superfamily N-acetyltransferase
MPLERDARVEIVRAAPDRLGPLSELLGRAFVDEPMLRWPLGTHGDLAARFIRAFELQYETLVERGMLWEARDARVARGAALWIPAAAGEAYDASLEASRERIHALTDDGGRRWDRFWEWVEANLPAEPVWHLDAVAVAPPYRGTGIGAALIRFGLERARRERAPAFLETATQGNIAVYRHFGFEVIHHANAPDGGPHVWFMRARPNASN